MASHRPTPIQVLRSPPILIATWFGAGLLPKAPGTWGSLAALPFAWGISAAGGPWALGAVTVAAFVVGVWASNGYLAQFGGEDPGPVVVDEAAGQWLTLVAAPLDLVMFGLGFVFFRVADILKPWPAGWADRRVKGGLGIMLDDVLAAVYAGAALHALAHVLSEGT